MSSEHEKIQAMLDEGTITAEEALDLLAALPERADATGAPVELAARPALPARGEAWRKPFAVTAVLTATGAVKLMATRNRGGFLGFVHTFLIWPFTILAGLAAVVIYLSKDAPWLHVRIHEKDGSGFTFSLPYPGPALERGLHFAQQQASSEDAREKIDAVLEALDDFDNATGHESLLLDIEDEGDGVQIYLN